MGCAQRGWYPGAAAKEAERGPRPGDGRAGSAPKQSGPVSALKRNKTSAAGLKRDTDIAGHTFKSLSFRCYRHFWYLLNSCSLQPLVVLLAPNTL